MKINQKGFSIVEILIIIVIIGLIGAVGWLVYDRQSSKSKNEQTTTNVTQPSQTSEVTEQSKKTEVSNEPQLSYVTIKEWGIKIPNTPSGNVVSYQISADDKNMAVVVSSEQKELGGNCGTFGFARYRVFQAENGYKSNDNVFQNKLNYAVENNLVIKANNKSYYIIGDASGGDCTGVATEGQGVTEQEITANTNLRTALKGIVASE